jgi:hypothetical protein
MPAGRYRITNPTIGVFLENGRHVAHMVPGGAEITIDSEDFAGDRLVEVTWDGRKVMMFAQDLRSRAEAVGD